MLRLHIIQRGVEFQGKNLAGNDTVSMGESRNEEVTDLNEHGGFAEHGERLPDMRLVSAAGRAAMPADNDVFEPCLECQRLRSLCRGSGCNAGTIDQHATICEKKRTVGNKIPSVAGNKSVSKGESKDEEVIAFNDIGDAAKQCRWLRHL